MPRTRDRAAADEIGSDPSAQRQCCLQAHERALFLSVVFSALAQQRRASRY